MLGLSSVLVPLRKRRSSITTLRLHRTVYGIGVHKRAWYWAPLRVPGALLENTALDDCASADRGKLFPARVVA